MWPRFNDSSLLPVRDKLENHVRLEYDDGLALLYSNDMEGIRALADCARRTWVGDEVYYIHNYHLYYSNVCIWGCKFCAFSRRKNSPEAYTKTIKEITRELGRLEEAPSEIRITGGINPKLGLDYFLEMLGWIRQHMPDTHIEAFAPTEIDYLCRREGLGVWELLSKLKQAGLGSLTCGGAEIFSQSLRTELCPRKTSSRRWMEVVNISHLMGLPSNASILYGHLEKYEDRLEHLLTIRELQNRTGGFNSFIPLCFLPANTRLAHIRPASEREILKMMAVCRLMLDNFRYIKFLWIYHGLELARQALDYGVNDLGGTVNEGHKGVARSAGSKSGGATPKSDFLNMILEKGRRPVERGVLYNGLRATGLRLLANTITPTPILPHQGEGNSVPSPLVGES